MDCSNELLLVDGKLVPPRNGVTTAPQPPVPPFLPGPPRTIFANDVRDGQETIGRLEGVQWGCQGGVKGSSLTEGIQLYALTMQSWRTVQKSLELVNSSKSRYGSSPALEYQLLVASKAVHCE